MTEQLSFASMFEEAAFEQRSSHLPAAMSDGVLVFRALIERYNAALLIPDLVAAQALNDEAHDLALKLNGGDPAILADDTSPGNVLELESAAQNGDVPLWGQTGQFFVETRTGLKALILMEGIFGLAHGPVPSFSAFAVEPDKPFLSETGYRSFLGRTYALSPGTTPDAYARRAIEEHIARALKGRLPAIEERYRVAIQSPECPYI